MAWFVMMVENIPVGAPTGLFDPNCPQKMSSLTIIIFCFGTNAALTPPPILC
jgi:hypothetical protein